MKTYQILATRLKELRNERGLSHVKLGEALAEQYGVLISKDSLINYEVAEDNHVKAGSSINMRVEYLFYLADFYGVSLDYLLGKIDDRSVDADERVAVKYTGLGQEALQNISLKIKSEPLMADLLNHLFTDIGFLDCLDKLLDYYIVYVNELNAERKPASWAECSNPNGSWRVKDVLNWQHQMDALSQLSDFPKYDMSEIIRYKVVEAFNAVLDRLEV